MVLLFLCAALAREPVLDQPPPEGVFLENATYGKVKVDGQFYRWSAVRPLLVTEPAPKRILDRGKGFRIAAIACLAVSVGAAGGALAAVSEDPERTNLLYAPFLPLLGGAALGWVADASHYRAVDAYNAAKGHPAPVGVPVP